MRGFLRAACAFEHQTAGLVIHHDLSLKLLLGQCGIGGLRGGEDLRQRNHGGAAAAQGAGVGSFQRRGGGGGEVDRLAPRGWPRHEGGHVSGKFFGRARLCFFGQPALLGLLRSGGSLLTHELLRCLCLSRVVWHRPAWADGICPTNPHCICVSARDLHQSVDELRLRLIRVCVHPDGDGF